MIKASKLAVAMAVVGPLAVATVGETIAAPVLTNASAVKAAAPATATTVQYWAYVGQPYFDYGYGPYAYRPAYKYQGYTYWYPTYSNWGYPYSWW
jgi:hypothetical protein